MNENKQYCQCIKKLTPHGVMEVMEDMKTCAICGKEIKFTATEALSQIEYLQRGEYLMDILKEVKETLSKLNELITLLITPMHTEEKDYGIKN